MKVKSIILGGAIVAIASLSTTSNAVMLRVSIMNLAPSQGTFLTPMWFGLHNGSFDLYDNGQPISAQLERLAEDGSTAPISSLFTTTGAGLTQGTLNGIGAIGPGQTASMTFEINGALSTSRFFSYASMIIPSNDAFIANGNPTLFQAFDSSGNFTAIDFIVGGDRVLDAGSEVNDELPANTAFFGQSSPNTGVTENGVVGTHSGFNVAAPGNILGSTMFANANFKQPGYNVARIRVESVPEPTTMVALCLGAATLIKRRRK